MVRSWNAYSSYAWGEDFLRPLTLQGEDLHGLSYTIIDSLDTLYMMNLTTELDYARAWLNSSFHPHMTASIFEANIRGVGGLLSIYEMTGDRLYLDLAKNLSYTMSSAFNTATGLPQSLINFGSGEASSHPWAPKITLLADAGSLQIEMLALGIHTGNFTLANLALAALNTLQIFSPLPPTRIFNNLLWPNSDEISMDAFGDSYYEYLLKLALYCPSNYSHIFNFFVDATKAAEKRLIFTNIAGKFEYVASIRGGRIDHRHSHLSFFIPGAMYLASKYGNSSFSKEFLRLGKSLLKTGLKLYDISASKLGGDQVAFLGEYPGAIWIDDTYKLRPELVESLLYAWRIDRDFSAREAAWKIFLRIEQFCSVQTAYSSISQASDDTVVFEDIMDSYFLSETLKYLYLMFSDDSFFSFDKYIFTTEAHPLLRRI